MVSVPEGVQMQQPLSVQTVQCSHVYYLVSLCVYVSFHHVCLPQITHTVVTFCWTSAELQFASESPRTLRCYRALVYSSSLLQHRPQLLHPTRSGGAEGGERGSERGVSVGVSGLGQRLIHTSQLSQPLYSPTYVLWKISWTTYGRPIQLVACRPTPARE